MDFKTLHLYNRLVRRDMAKPILCPYCNEEYTITIDDKTQPQLKCFGCNAIVTIGKNLEDKIQSVVKEHFDV